MDEPGHSLSIPEDALADLPADGGTIENDMHRAIDRLESRLRSVQANDTGETIADLVGDLENRRERYKEFVPELRAWGQSPVYALAWRTLYASLLEQLRAIDARDGPEVAETGREQRDSDPATSDSIADERPR